MQGMHGEVVDEFAVAVTMMMLIIMMMTMMMMMMMMTTMVTMLQGQRARDAR